MYVWILLRCVRVCFFFPIIKLTTRFKICIEDMHFGDRFIEISCTFSNERKNLYKDIFLFLFGKNIRNVQFSPNTIVLVLSKRWIILATFYFFFSYLQYSYFKYSYYV